jgi:SAM-dependent MidA family methyltransferase
LPARLAGYETEVNLEALDWIGNLSSKLKRGYVLVIDYGFSREEFYASDRSTGTLRVRAQHRPLASPFEQIGQADITTHVDWTSVAERAEDRGLRVVGFADQHHFLTGIISGLGRGGSPEPPANANPARIDWGQSPLPEINSSAKTRRSLQTLLHPEMLGRSFQALALTKGVATPGEAGQLLQTKEHADRKGTDGRSWATHPIQRMGCPSGAKRVDPTPALSGFKFARNARAALGL